LSIAACAIQKVAGMHAIECCAKVGSPGSHGPRRDCPWRPHAVRSDPAL